MRRKGRGTPSIANDTFFGSILHHQGPIQQASDPALSKALITHPNKQHSPTRAKGPTPLDASSSRSLSSARQLLEGFNAPSGHVILPSLVSEPSHHSLWEDWLVGTCFLAPAFWMTMLSLSYVLFSCPTSTTCTWGRAVFHFTTYFGPKGTRLLISSWPLRRGSVR